MLITNLYEFLPISAHDRFESISFRWSISQFWCRYVLGILRCVVRSVSTLVNRRDGMVKKPTVAASVKMVRYLAGHIRDQHIKGFFVSRS